MRMLALIVLLMNPITFAAAPVAQPGQPAQPTRPPVAAAATAPVAAAAPAGGDEFASFGVSFTAPAGWRRIVEGGTGMIARWARMGADGKATALLTIEMEPLGKRTAEQYAAERAKTAGVAPVASPVAMGGEPTWVVSGLKVGAMTAETMTAQHGKYLYVIAGMSDDPQALPRAEMQAMVKSVKFAPPGDPSRHTQLRGERFPLFGRITIIPLATMRPNPGPPPAGMVGVSTFNFAAGRPDLIAYIQAIPNEAGVTMEQLQSQFPGKLAPTATLKWTKVPGSAAAERTISSTFDATDGTQTQATRIALVRIGDSDAVLIHFSIVATDPAARAAYEKASEAMTASIEPVGK